MRNGAAHAARSHRRIQIAASRARSREITHSAPRSLASNGSAPGSVLDRTFAGVQLYPPIHWRTRPERQPIPGAAIKPGQSLNLFFGLIRTGLKDGDANGPVITYTANRNSYTLREQSGFVISAPHSHCPY